MNKLSKGVNKRLTYFPSTYEICVRGRISGQGAIWFEGMTLAVNETTSPPQTIIRGEIIDQATLYGLINRLRDLGLTLISVNRLDQQAENE